MPTSVPRELNESRGLRGVCESKQMPQEAPEMPSKSIVLEGEGGMKPMDIAKATIAENDAKYEALRGSVFQPRNDLDFAEDPRISVPNDTRESLERYAASERKRQKDNPVLQSMITWKSLANHILRNEVEKRGFYKGK